MNFFIRTLVFAPILACATLVGPPAVASVALPVANDGSGYAAGTQSMNDKRWPDAIAFFDQVIHAKGKKADAALYWKAYSLAKLNQGQLAAATCAQLFRQYHASPWNRDCSVLKQNLRPGQVFPATESGELVDREESRADSSGGSSATKDAGADLKMMAINSLLHRDPAQAIPLLRGILTGDQPAEIKQHALFVLAQSSSPEALAVMHDLVTGKSGSQVQRQAIQSVGLFQGKRGNDTLAEVYRTTSDPQVKQAVLSAFFISQDDTRMVDLARSEKNVEWKRAIVAQLSLMSGKAATDYMIELLK